MNRKTYATVTAAVFLVVGIAHLLRIILGWHVEIGGLNIPFWVSWLAVPITVALAYFGFMERDEWGADAEIVAARRADVETGIDAPPETYPGARQPVFVGDGFGRSRVAHASEM